MHAEIFATKMCIFKALFNEFFMESEYFTRVVYCLVEKLALQSHVGAILNKNQIVEARRRWNKLFPPLKSYLRLIEFAKTN